jgi:hypothetical protein
VTTSSDAVAAVIARQLKIPAIAREVTVMDKALQTTSSIENVTSAYVPA